jgi:hypothetical protein
MTPMKPTATAVHRRHAIFSRRNQAARITMNSTRENEIACACASGRCAKA